jgi:protein phosphatase-4 regulatory subunit 3
MRNNVVEKILRLTRRREKYLVVAAVRFLRTCIALKVRFLPIFAFSLIDGVDS